MSFKNDFNVTSFPVVARISIIFVISLWVSTYFEEDERASILIFIILMIIGTIIMIYTWPRGKK